MFLSILFNEILKKGSHFQNFVKAQHKVCGIRKNMSAVRGLQRQWKPALNKTKEVNESNGGLPEQFKLLSYNILAQDLIVDNMFLYYDIDRRFLHWDYRLQQIIREICELQPDLLCLQEVQHTHLREIVKQLQCKAMRSRKMEYIFKKRTGSRCDGCAIFYDKDKFKLIEDLSLEYFKDNNSMLNRENVAILAKFELRCDSRSIFITANTHLLYNPRRSDVRISQINKLMSAITSFSEVSKKSSQFWPVILAGDLNCQSSSAEYNFLTSKSKFTGQDSRNLQNIYMESIDFGSQAASTFHGQWITVDYIFKSNSKRNKKNVQVMSVYKLPTIEDCKTYSKLPCKCIGSDHFSLCFQFSLV